MAENAELSPEDSLRLNVLLAQKPEAVRIDESRLIVHALTAKGEARVELNPNCETAAYLRQVKAMLSSHVMGSPGGYPVFLDRWTRMGQTRDNSLEQLLLLGESEAVVAVAHAPGLTAALARRVWWAMPDAVSARQMLKNSDVAVSELGREIAAFLLEFLPFEAVAGDMLESARLVLQPGLIDEDEVHKLWQRAQIKPNLLVGFLRTMPDTLPLNAEDHPSLLTHLQLFDGPEVAMLKRVMSAQGQAFLQTCEWALAKVTDQDVVVSLFEAIANYFSTERFTDVDYRDVAKLEAAVDQLDCQLPKDLENYARSVWFLSAISVELLNPIFSHTDAIGSGMRQKINPLTERIFHHLKVLQPQ